MHMDCYILFTWFLGYQVSLYAFIWVFSDYVPLKEYKYMCVMARQGYHQNTPCGATAPLGRSCKMGVPERGGGKKGVYCLN